MALRPLPRYTLAHLSDPHLTGDGSPVGGAVDPRARLSRALEVLTSWNVACDAWVFTGDLSNDGSAASYTTLRDLVSDAAARAGVPVVWVNGNHDERAPFRTALLGEDPSDEPYLAEHRFGGLRVLVVDSTIPGVPEGRLEPATLAWLARRLGTAARDGTVLALHHAPFPQLQDAAHLWSLENPRELADVIRGTDVRTVLAGHFHHTAFGTLAGVPVSAATALVYTQDVTVGRDLRGQDAHQGFSLVELYEDAVVHTAVPLDAAVGVLPAMDSAEARARLARRAAGGHGA